MYLLDTNVISELKRLKPHGAVIEWLRSIADSDLHISAVTIGELQAGVEVTRRQDAVRAKALEEWLEQICETYNIVAMDASAFRCWARLMDRRSNNLNEDAMIAATAIVRNLTVVTCNIRDFDLFGVRTLNPFEIARS